jgi:prepilin-type N-terminal cleavage/methylation domain-containing protein
MRNLRNSKGFTLIELMIVVVIIGILAAIAIPKFANVSKNAKQAEVSPILKQICTLAQTYQDQNSADAANIGALAGVGWQDPNAKYFGTWSYAAGSAGSSLTAAGTGAGLTAKSRNCNTGVES